MVIRNEFEKLHEVKKDIENYRLRYNEKLNAYTGLDGKIKNDAIWVNGAWYAFQEQQKKIDALKDCITNLVKQKNKANAKLDNIQEIIELKTSGSFTSVLRKIDAISEELLK